MYKIAIANFTPEMTTPECEVMEKDYECSQDAQRDMMEFIIEETATLNQPDASLRRRTNICVPMLNYVHNGETYDGAIVMWDGARHISEQVLRLYKINWENVTPADEYNKKLKDMYGDRLTLWIRAEEVEDVESEKEEVTFVEKYYFEGATCEKDELYDTPEEAFHAAVAYMEYLCMCGE